MFSCRFGSLWYNVIDYHLGMEERIVPSPWKDKSLSPEHRAKIAASNKGKKKPWCAGESNPMKSPEVREKVRMAQLGQIRSYRGERHHKFKGYRDPEERKPCICDECQASTDPIMIYRWARSSIGKTIARENRYAIGHHMKGKKRPEISARQKGKIPGGVIRRGPDHPQWKDGKAAERQAGRNSPEYKAWRDTVYRRDNWTCQICLKKVNGKNIVAHHYLGWVEYPEYRYEVWNGVTMCRDCHKEYFHADVGKATRFNRESNPPPVPRKGRKLTPEHRAKISAALRAPGMFERLSAVHKGKNLGNRFAAKPMSVGEVISPITGDVHARTP